jgi:hypothetical protein
MNEAEMWKKKAKNKDKRNRTRQSGTTGSFTL